MLDGIGDVMEVGIGNVMEEKVKDVVEGEDRDAVEERMGLMCKTLCLRS